MRFCPLYVAGCCLLLWTSTAATAQQPTKKPEAVPELKIGDRTLAEWIAEIPSKDRAKAENAMRTLPLFAPEEATKGVPAILAELKKHGKEANLDTSTRETAAVMLGEILARAEKPDPRVLDDAVAALRRLLGDSQSFIKYRAAEALGRIGVRAKAAVPELLAAATDKDAWGVRQGAIIALGTVGAPGKAGPDPAIVKTLCAALRDDTGQVRLAAAQTLFWLGPPPAANKQEVATALTAVTRDPEPAVQMMAHVSLIKIKAKGWEAHLGALGKFMNSSDPLLRVNAAEALGTVGPEAQSQVPRLIEGLKDRDQRVVGTSIWALGQLARSAVEALPHLQALAADRERPENLRKMATEAVNAIQGRKK